MCVYFVNLLLKQACAFTTRRWTGLRPPSNTYSVCHLGWVSQPSKTACATDRCRSLWHKARSVSAWAFHRGPAIVAAPSAVYAEIHSVLAIALRRFCMVIYVNSYRLHFADQHVLWLATTHLYAPQTKGHSHSVYFYCKSV
jgi:hypothetical protein